MADAETSATILRPINAYNEFARAYQCQVTTPALSWTNPVRIDSDTVLNIRGLHSALLSGLYPELEERKLYLGPVQTGVIPEYGTINLILSHHPPEWMEDKTDLEDRMLTGPHIAMFGHEHRPDVSQAQSDCILIRAGSANPDRKEKGWSPAYGWLSISIEGEEPKRTARVRIRQYTWQRTPAGFVPVIYSRQGDCVDYRDYLLPIDGVNVVDESQGEKGANLAAVQMSNDEKSKTTRGDSPKQRPDIRSMLFQIWRLSHSERKAVFAGLGLGGALSSDDEDSWVEEAFREAITKDLLLELNAAITEKGNY